MAGEEISTVLVRHLPEGIPDSTLSLLFSHFGGAASVRSFPPNSAFVDFHSQSSAHNAIQHFNGLRFLGKVLRVERASKAESTRGGDEKNSGGTHRGGERLPRAEIESKAESTEPIAASIGVEYHFPPNLEYVYPPPDGNILTNIVNSLIAVPRFYTQVLHLMNKMNIPAPFRMAMPTPPLPPLAPALPLPDSEHTKKIPTEVSSEESEMESSDEEVGEDSNRRRKRMRREAIVGPAVDKDIAHEAVGVKEATLMPKEIPMIRKRNPVLQIKIAYKAEKKEEQIEESITTTDTGIPKTESRDSIQPFATPEEIHNGKLGPEELLSLPVYKNYKAGNPASVLYIKNLAKDVVNNDFYFIFGSLFGSVDLAKSSLSVKLMQEGRMRGQAFVTFPTVDLAHHALNLVNGFEFKGKPMVIQFGRSPVIASKEN